MIYCLYSRSIMIFWPKKIKQLEKKQRLIIYSIFTVITLALLSVSAIASYRYFASPKSTQISNNLENLDQEIEFDLSQIEVENQDSLTVLLAGYGGAGHQGGFLSDVIQVMHINFLQQKISFISIPRDLYLNEGYKVNAIMSHGMSQKGQVNDGLELMSQKISQITGLPIKYFVGIDFVGFKRTIGNELNSIEVEVSQTLDDPWYPIDGAQLDPCGYSPEEIASLTANLSGFALESKFACRYEHIYYPAGKVKMEGHEALAYVRSRHSSSDYDRSRRQVELLTAIRNKLFELETIKKLPKAYEAMSKHVNTNLDLESAKKLAPLLVNGKEFTIQNINLSPENVLQSSTSQAGAFILLPKAGANQWQEIRTFVKEKI